MAQIDSFKTRSKLPVGGVPYDSVAIMADGPHLDAFLARPDAVEVFTPLMEMRRERP